ncbi:hypothetical protein DL768_006918 [Monosporascus sp. mg162]|nr:hypothetical protein DL768_006918 [Monosporascus sp. mg162]
MDGLSAAASGFAVISVAIQLADGCIRLRNFWESVRDAPGGVAVITHDLRLLSAVLEDVSRGGLSSPAVVMGLNSCLVKIQRLSAIVAESDLDFWSTSRRERITPGHSAHDEQGRIPVSKQPNADTQLSVVDLKNEGQKIVPPKAVNNSFVKSNRVIKAALQQSMQIAVDDFLASGTIEELLANTTGQIVECNTQSYGTYTSEDYHIQSSAMYRPPYQYQKSPYANFSRASRICHRTSSVGVLFGKIWVRTSTLRLATKSGATGGEFQITTSFIFYPSSWLTRAGLGHGVEAILQNSKGGWKFDFNPIRAVPDDSLIFELCRDGNWRGVERLLRRQEASLRDTSSQGWTPLHFAAEAGHVELCDMLLQSGADKRALAFKGPSEDALSPVTIFVATNHDLPAEHKIRMLRLFSDCLELTDPSGDGWTVHAELKRAYNRERVPIPENSISWLLRATAAEEFITFGPKTIWSGIQSSVRSFLVHERNEACSSRERERAVANDD